MATFDYEAVDLQGRTRRGIVTADSARLARRELRQNRLFPVSIETADNAKSQGKAAPRLTLGARVRSGDLMVMTRQLATMLAAAAPLNESLQTVGLQTESKALRTVVLSVRTSVNEGATFADALSRYPRVFGPMYRAMVAAGEMTGSLGAVLERLADHLEKADRMGSRIMSALIYPMVLAGVACGVVGILLTFVVPKVIDQFQDLGQQLPFLTRSLVWLSDSLALAILPAGVLAVCAVIGLRILWRDEEARLKRDRLILKLPIVGRVLRRLFAARLARTMGTLLSSGVPALEAIAAAKATVANLEMSRRASIALTAIREGMSVSAAFKKADLFPPLVLYMMSVGESSGQLDSMLTKSADQLERELEDATSVAVGLLEPGIIVVMGAVVGLIIMAILMPIFQLNSLALM